MHVTVEVYGDLQRFLGNGRHRVEMEVRESTTVRDVLLSLGIDVMDPWNASLNGTLASPEDTVPQGATILVFPPIAGGACSFRYSTQEVHHGTGSDQQDTQG